MRVKPSELDNMPPSAKQQRCVALICERYNLKKPSKFTFEAFDKFIATHIDTLRTDLIFDAMVNQLRHDAEMDIIDARRDW